MSNHYRLPLDAEPPREYFPGSGTDRVDYEEQQLGGPPPPSKFFRCICSTACVLILSVAVLVILIAIKWQLKDPIMTANQISVTKLNFSEKSISGEFSVKFSLWNDNTVMRVRYENITSEVLYKTELIGVGQINPFEQGTKNFKQITTFFNVESAPLSARKISQLKNETCEQGFMHLNFILKADMVEMMPVIDDMYRFVQAKCDGLEVLLDTNRTAGSSRSDRSKHCELFISKLVYEEIDGD